MADRCKISYELPLGVNFLAMTAEVLHFINIASNGVITDIESSPQITAIPSGGIYRPEANLWLLYPSPEYALVGFPEITGSTGKFFASVNPPDAVMTASIGVGDTNLFIRQKGAPVLFCAPPITPSPAYVFAMAGLGESLQLATSPDAIAWSLVGVPPRGDTLGSQNIATGLAVDTTSGRVFVEISTDPEGASRIFSTTNLGATWTAEFEGLLGNKLYPGREPSSLATSPSGVVVAAVVDAGNGSHIRKRTSAGNWSVVKSFGAETGYNVQWVHDRFLAVSAVWDTFDPVFSVHHSFDGATWFTTVGPAVNAFYFGGQSCAGYIEGTGKYYLGGDGLLTESEDGVEWTITREDINSTFFEFAGV